MSRELPYQPLICVQAKQIYYMAVDSSGVPNALNTTVRERPQALLDRAYIAKASVHVCSAHWRIHGAVECWLVCVGLRVMSSVKWRCQFERFVRGEPAQEFYDRGNHTRFPSG